MGNSHVASLKNSWDSESSLEFIKNHTVDFFAHRKDLMKGLIAQNNVLKPDNSNLLKAIQHTSSGLDCIDPSRYDLFFIYGCGLKIDVFATSNYSNAVLKNTVSDLVHDSTSLHLCEQLRSISEKPIIVGHNPLRAKYEKELKECIDIEMYQSICDLLQQHIFDSIDITLIKQPIKTIHSGIATSMKYVSNSTRLDIGDDISNDPHPERNRGHMNAEFGTLMWKQLFECVSANCLLEYIDDKAA